MKTASMLALAAVCSLLCANGQDKNPVVLAKTILLPDVPGGFNHMSEEWQ